MSSDVTGSVGFSDPSSDTVSAVEEVPVSEESPYGFGPFPAVPQDYFLTAEEVWGEVRLRTMLPEHELLARVQM